MAIGAKKITLPITNESTGTVSNVEYSFVQTDNTLTISGAAADAKKTGDELSDLKQDYNSLSESKADKTTNNPSMGAGYASQLNSTLRKSDQTPYNFRKVPYDSTLEDGSIIGASVAWNQLIADPHTSHSLNRDSSRTYYLSTNDTSCVIGHRYFLSATITEDTTTIGVTFEYGGGTSLNFKGTGRHSAILKQATSVASSVYTGIPTSEASGTKATYTDVLLTDLTQMLGTTIADYVYTLETATAGSGVAWLKEHFPKQFGGEYQAYNAGEIKSISGLAEHKMTGKNLAELTIPALKPLNTNGTWNGNTYTYRGITFSIQTNLSGGISGIKATGTASSTAELFFVPYAINNGETYILSGCPTGGSNSSYAVMHAVESSIADYGSGYTFTKNSNISNGFRIRIASGYAITSNGIMFHPMIRFASVTDSTYEPYESHTYALDSTKTLRGILKLDSNNKLYADGDRYLPKGKKDARFGEVDLGTLDWVYVSSGSVFAPYFYAPIPNMKQPTNIQTAAFDIICDKYVTTPRAQGTFVSGCICADVSGSTPQIQIIDTTYTGSSAFKTAMSGVKLIYPLATPTTETAEPYGNPQVINPDGTESYVYTDGAFELPVGHTSEYPVNVSGQLDDILDTPTTNGTYKLQATVTDGAVSYEWVSAT